MSKMQGKETIDAMVPAMQYWDGIMYSITIADGLKQTIG